MEDEEIYLAEDSSNYDEEFSIHRRGVERDTEVGPNVAQSTNVYSDTIHWDIKVQFIFGILTSFPALGLAIPTIQSLFLEYNGSCESPRMAMLTILVIGSVGMVLAGLGAFYSSKINLRHFKQAAEETLEQAEKQWTQMKPIVDELQTVPFTQYASLSQKYETSQPLQTIGFVFVSLFGAGMFLVLFIMLGQVWFSAIYNGRVIVSVILIGSYVACVVVFVGVLFYYRTRLSLGVVLGVLFFLFLALLIVEGAFLLQSIWIAILFIGGVLITLGVAYVFRGRIITYLNSQRQGESVAILILALLPTGLVSSSRSGATHVSALQGASYGGLAVYCFYTLILFCASSELIIQCFHVPKMFVVLLLLSTLSMGTLTLINAVLCSMNHTSSLSSNKNPNV